ncbi:MAG: lytic transglycosylase domain-containing protein [Methylophilus sp.]|nr:lytic transglycosylase domain-containing protein [Methylophilus sp.]
MSSPYVYAGNVYIDASLDDEITISSEHPESNHVIIIQDETVLGNETVQRVDANHLPYHDEVVAAAKATTLDPALIHAVIAVESKHNPNAVSARGAYGLMQLMPATAKRFNVKNKRDCKQNILAGAQYLKELLGMFHGNLSLALAAYNAGPATVQKYNNQIPPYLETKLYVPKVLKYYQKFSA